MLSSEKLNVRAASKDFYSGIYPNVDADTSLVLFWPAVFTEFQTKIKENSEE